MRARMLVLAVAVGCGPRVVVPPAAPAPVPEPPPAADAPPAPTRPTPNVDASARVTWGDGRAHAGRLVRVERGLDWYAETGWEARPERLVVTVEDGGREVDVAWSDIAAIDLSYGGIDDVGCQYDSSFTPWMYMCLLPVQATVTTVDGRARRAASRHVWRLTFDDDTEATVYLVKLAARAQDERTAGFDSTENPDMYPRLTEAAAAGGRTGVTRIVIEPR